ncbi:MAG: MFS transporter [Hyphomicrobiaceae bacterium]|nr:MAG: MFS transporter [Hyphomicrobiaceae bacterium]
MVAGALQDTDRQGARASELQTLATVSAAHLVSHIYIMTLPVLLPFLKERYGVGFFELGLAITTFNVVTALTQAPTGFLVDRVGPRGVLMAGLSLGGLAFAMLGFTTSYPLLIAAAFLGGLANCVYHPADYAILADGIAEHRIGRAFSIHTFAGFLGGALAPPVLLGLLAFAGFTTALVFVGLLGPLAAVALALTPPPKAREAVSKAHPVEAKAKGARGATAGLLTPAILGLTVFFTLISLTNGAMGGFSVVAFIGGHGLSLAAANTALTAFLICGALGVLAGGSLADRTRRHGEVAALGYGVSALIVVGIALLTPPVAVIVVAMALSGFLTGIIQPSRDMLVRKAAPPGAVGRAFGIVSTGFNIGGIIGPLLLGWIMDNASPRWVFGAGAAFMAAIAVFGLMSERRSAARAAEAR